MEKFMKIVKICGFFCLGKLKKKKKMTSQEKDWKKPLISFLMLLFKSNNPTVFILQMSFEKYVASFASLNFCSFFKILS